MSTEIVKAAGNQLSPIAKAQNILNNLLPAAQKLMVAALQPKIKELPAVDVVNSFSAIVTGTYTIAGQQPEAYTLALYIDEFYQTLFEKYPAVTIDEVRAALRAGVYGEYGEYYGLNPKTFLSWVKAYLFSEERREAKKLYEAGQLQLSAPVLSEEEKRKSNEEFINLLYENFLADALVSDYIPGYLYDFLTAQGRLNLSNEAKKEIKGRADSYHTRLLTANDQAIRYLMLSPSLKLETKDPEITRRNIAKQFAVYEYFERCRAWDHKTIFNKALPDTGSEVIYQ